MDNEVGRLGEAVESFIELIHCLNESSLKPAKGKKWGPREVLIHLVAWHEQYSLLAADAASARSREPFKGTLKEFNRQAVAENMDAAIHELVTRWVKAHKALTRTAEEPGADRLKIALNAGSKQWPLRDLIRLAAGHIEKHEFRLRGELKMPRRGLGSAASL